MNRQYELLFGIKRQDIVGLTDHDLFPKELADDFRANDLKALARGAPIQMEEVAPHPDGPHTYITVKYPISDADGRPCIEAKTPLDLAHLEPSTRPIPQRTAASTASASYADTCATSPAYNGSTGATASGSAPRAEIRAGTSITASSARNGSVRPLRTFATCTVPVSRNRPPTNSTAAPE